MFYETLFQPLSYLIFIMILETWQVEFFSSPTLRPFPDKKQDQRDDGLKGRVTLESECLYAGSMVDTLTRSTGSGRKRAGGGNRSQPLENGAGLCRAVQVYAHAAPLLGPLSLFASWAPTILYKAPPYISL